MKVSITHALVILLLFGTSASITLSFFIFLWIAVMG